MTLKDLVLKWDNDWRYDYWWRQKHNVAFNSSLHREVSQFDIAFEYMENKLSCQAIDEFHDEEDKKKLRENGQWMIKRKISKEKEDELFGKIDLRSF